MTLDVIPSSQIAFIQYDKEIRNLNLLQRYNCDRCFGYTKSQIFLKIEYLFYYELFVAQYKVNWLTSQEPDAKYHLSLNPHTITAIRISYSYVKLCSVLHERQ